MIKLRHARRAAHAALDHFFDQLAEEIERNAPAQPPSGKGGRARVRAPIEDPKVDPVLRETAVRALRRAGFRTT